MVSYFLSFCFIYAHHSARISILLLFLLAFIGVGPIPSVKDIR